MQRSCFVMLLLASCATLCAAQGVEIDSSILVVGPGDYLPSNGGPSRCEQSVARATALTQTRLMFVPTLFWVDESAANGGTRSVNAQSNVSFYCVNRQGSGSSTTCPEVTEDDISALKSAMSSCFGAAVSAGLDIAISPHLDDGLGLGGWRNGLTFDPLEQYGNFRYTDFFLFPLADALNEVMQADTKVYFGMQGEMSATVFYHPQSYITLINTLRSRVLRGKPSSYFSNVKIGTSTNFNKLCGCVLQDLVDPGQYLSLYPAAFAPLKGEFDLEAIQELFNSVDFIGISSYASSTPNFTIDKLESATYQFSQEVSSFGVDIPDLIFNKGKQLFWNEYGVGGGATQDGMTKATTAEQTAATPFFGVFGQYTKNDDPWELFNENEVNGPRSYLHYFYNSTIQYLNSGGKGSSDCPGCQYRTDGLYLWNDASWDIQAIYPESTSDEGSYKDQFLVDLFNNHNREVASSQSSQTASTTAGRRLLSAQ